MERHIVLIGMMGSGKTTTGKILSQMLGISFIDTDEVIEERENMSISEIFKTKGERYFREKETVVLNSLLNNKPSIIATGGGIILSSENREMIKKRSIPIFLYGDIEVLAKRLEKASDRPLLEGDVVYKRLKSIWSDREKFYREFENSVNTNTLTPLDVAIKIITQFLPPQDIAHIDEGVVVGRGAIKELGQTLKDKNYKEPLLIVTSSVLWERWGEYIKSGLHGFSYKTFFLPDGEKAKTMENVYKLWEVMFSLGFTRKNPVLLLGGGTIGDTGGFAASTFMRGLPLFQIPTTLLSQIDSSIGGKRGVNYKHLKNMIGTFYDASLTILDPVFLLTLPEKEIKSGLAEVIKSAIIGDSSLFDFIDAHTGEIFDKNIPVFSTIIEKTVAVKLKVVEKDPYELTGYRKVLNLGHTLGHALEGIEGFSLSHGEGVAIGMVFASFLGEKMGITPAYVRRKIENIIKKVGLPITFPDKYIEMALNKMFYDKKREDDKLFWVIPEKIGKVSFYKFSPEEIRDALRSFCKEYPYDSET